MFETTVPKTISRKNCDRLLNVTYNALKLSQEERAKISATELEDIRKLFCISVALKSARGTIKEIQFPNQETAIYDMLVKGEFDQAIAVIEAAAGGSIYEPYRPGKAPIIIEAIPPPAAV